MFVWGNKKLALGMGRDKRKAHWRSDLEKINKICKMNNRKIKFYEHPFNVLFGVYFKTTGLLLFCRVIEIRSVFFRYWWVS